MESDEHSPESKNQPKGIIAVDPYFWGLNEFLSRKQDYSLNQKQAAHSSAHLPACSSAIRTNSSNRPRRWEAKVYTKPAYHRALERFFFLGN
ncbi:MAG TPA: hypothetical protein VGO45_09895 [Bacteroidia bacterium]|jgi:hypothetical protein|nr:hypothetical protein [Bacteroidia bacterium]